MIKVLCSCTLVNLLYPSFYYNLIQCIIKLVGKLLVLSLVHSVHCIHHPFHSTSERETNRKTCYVDYTKFQRMFMNVEGKMNYD